MISKIKNFLLSFSVLFFLASVTSFTAFNWKYFSSLEKLLLPSILMLVALFLFLFLKQERYKQLSLFSACFLIGILFAIFGQIYQTGADSWILFRNWAFFLVLPIFLTAYYSIIFLFISVSSLAIFFYLGLYYDILEAFYIATLLPAFVIACYPYITKRWKLAFHSFFYRLIVILFYIFFHIAGALLTFSSYRWGSFSSYLLTFSYPLIAALLFWIGYKIYQQYIFLPFSILSVGIIFWVFFSNHIFQGFSSDLILYFSFSIAIFVGTFVALKKQLPPIESAFFHKILNFLGVFLKIFIFLLGLGLVISIAFLVGSGVSSFLVIGVGLLVFSCFFPQLLKLKEDKSELISFSLGLIALNYFLSETLLYQSSEGFSLTLFLGCFSILLFDVFYYFRPSRAMDLLFVPSHYYFLMLLYSCIVDRFVYVPWFVSFLVLLALIIQSLQLIFEKKIEEYKDKSKVQRIFYGNSLFLLLSPWFLNSSRFFLFFEVDTQFEFLQIISKNLETIAVILLSLLILFFAFPKREKRLLLFVVFAFIQYFASYIAGANICIMLLLLYFYLQKRWTTYVLKLLLGIEVFLYYYHLSGLSLLKKSYYLFLVSLVLLIAYLLIQYWGKELQTNEQK